MEKLKKIISSKWFCYLIIIIVAVLMSLPLFQKGISRGHDGDFHISRTVGTIEQMENDESIFVISRFSRGLGFGWNLFYPPISTFMNVIFTLITGNAILAIKLFIFFSFVLSGITMFQLVNTISKSKLAAIFSAVLYMIAPYRLLNSYTRLAVGELISFTFIPIILRGTYLILNGKTDKSYLFVLGTIGLVLSHNISTMLVFILGVIYVLINIKKLKDKKILKTFIISAVVIILSVLFFEVPLLEQKSTVDYEVFRYGKMYSRTNVAGHALNPLQLFFENASGADDSMYFCLGIPFIISLLLTPITIKKLHKESKKNYIFFFSAGIVAMVMSTFIFPWIIMPDILLMIQFPWRMHLIITFCFAIIGGINVATCLTIFLKKIDESQRTIILIICASLMIIASSIYSLSFVEGLELKDIDNSHYQEEEIIDIKYEVSRYSSFLEYWPQKAVRAINYNNEHDNKIHILSGNANIFDEEKINGTLKFSIDSVEDETILELPYLFYKGYKIEYYNAENEVQILTPTESEHGLLQISVDSNINGKFVVKYQITTLHKICLAISFTTITIYLTILLVKAFSKRKNK